MWGWFKGKRKEANRFLDFPYFDTNPFERLQKHANVCQPTQEQALLVTKPASPARKPLMSISLPTRLPLRSRHRRSFGPRALCLGLQTKGGTLAPLGMDEAVLGDTTRQLVQEFVQALKASLPHSATRELFFRSKPIYIYIYSIYIYIDKMEPTSGRGFHSRQT